MIYLKYSPVIVAILFMLGCAQKITSQGKETTTNKSTTKVYPAQVINLQNWKLTLPVDTEHAGSPDEIKQPELATYKSNWFTVNKAGTAVVFKVNAGGSTTSGSNFPRSELREMSQNGKVQASWSSGSGTHTLFIDQRVTHLPDVKKHIVVGQIHDAGRYVIFYRLEGKKLLVSVNKGEKIVLDPDYELGERFTVMFKVANNKTECYYNGKLKYTHPESFNGAYFKAGAYLQSSCKGAKKVEGEWCDAYGEVEIFDTWVKHE